MTATEAAELQNPVGKDELPATILPGHLMSNLFPKTATGVRDRIRRYERELKKEFSSGYVGDGYGKRYWLGPLYMLLGDVDGALKSFEWYEREFPDDSGEPWQYLMWALALHKGGHPKAAFVKLYQSILQNLYLVPHLLGEDPKSHDIWHGSNEEEIDYAMDIPDDLLQLWDEESLQWACEVATQPEVVEKVNRFIEIHRQLILERPGPIRSALVKEAYRLRDHQF